MMQPSGVLPMTTMAWLPTSRICVYIIDSCTHDMLNQKYFVQISR